MLGPVCDKRVLVQSMGTAALAGLARELPQARKPLQSAAAALLKARRSEGWSKDAASSQIHAVATSWAVFALGRARVAGARLPAGWEAKPLSGLRRLVDKRAGTATGGWASTVAVGAALASLGLDPESKVLAVKAREGARAHLAQPAMELADPETLALLALWMGADAEGLKAAFERWGGDPPRWEVRIPSKWDSLSGEAYATALAAWVLAIRGRP